MGRDVHDPILMQHHGFGHHAIDAAAHGRGCAIRGDATGNPALHEDAGDTVPRLHPGHARADGGNFSGTVGQRDQVGGQTAAAVGATHNHQITVVQAGGMHAHLDLERKRGRLQERVGNIGIYGASSLGFSADTNPFRVCAEGIPFLFPLGHRFPCQQVGQIIHRFADERRPESGLADAMLFP